MRDHPAWKKHETQKRWQGVFAVFIVIVLVFAALNGLLKSISIKNAFASSSWNSETSFKTYLDTEPGSVVVVQNEPKRIAIFRLNENLEFYTGDTNNPFIKLYDVSGHENLDLIKIISHAFGVKIDYNVDFNEELVLDEKSAQEYFKDFASIATPIKILTGQKTSGDMESNITRIDMIKLWWQVKGLGINDIDFYDLEEDLEEVIIGDRDRILGVDEESLNLKISKYTHNERVKNEDFALEINNMTRSTEALALASSIAQSEGFRVELLTAQRSGAANTNIVTGDENNFAVRHLASIFECDIVPAQTEEESNKIILNLGNDFVEKYFR